MTLLFMDGFDSANLIQKPEWDGLFPLTVNGRRGDANGAAGPPGGGVRTLTPPTPAATVVFGVAVTFAGGVNVTADYISIGIGTTDHLVLRTNATGNLQLRLSSFTGTILATGTATMPTTGWAHIQVKATIHATAGSVEVRVNGATTPDILYTGQTGTASGAATALRVAASAGSNRLNVDDMWVCDTVDATATQGRPNNDFLGDLKVVSLYPTADVAGSVAWVPSTGTSHAATVDETTPNTTDYISTPTVGNRDLFDVTDLPANTTAVYAQRVSVYAQKSDAGAMSVKPVIKDPAGTVAQSAVALSTSWTGVSGPMVTKKSDGSLITVADVNATQYGVDAA